MGIAGTYMYWHRQQRQLSWRGAVCVHMLQPNDHNLVGAGIIWIPGCCWLLLPEYWLMRCRNIPWRRYIRVGESRLPFDL